MTLTTIQPAFSSGEIAPALYGRVDLAKFHSGCATLRNMYVDYKGGARSRPGTHFVGQCKQGGGQTPPRLIRYQFNIAQGFVLEWGENYVRFIAAGAYITEPPVTITGATQANPCAISVAGTPFANNDWVFIAGVSGMSQLNGQTYIVANSGAGSFTLIDLFGVAVDSTAFGAYVSGGTVARIYTLATPYKAADLPLLKYTQSADTMSLTHTSYPPYDLKRITDSNWTLTKTDFGALIAAPTGCTVSSSQSITGVSATQYQFVVTAVDATTGQESIASNLATVSNSVDIAITAGSLTVGWTAVSGANSYNIYKAPAAIGSAGAVPVGSLFGYAGTSLGTQFVDSNITQDFTVVPPVHTDPFSIGAVVSVTPTNQGATYTQAATSATITSSAGTGAVIVPIIVGGKVVAFIVQNGGKNYANTDTVVITGDGSGATASLTVGPNTGTYPGVVTYFQQRRVYANTINNPDTYYMSQPGSFTDFDSSIPVKDDDAITGAPWSLQVNGIQFMVAMPNGLVIFTGLQAWQLSGGVQQSAVTPSNQVATPQAFSGCSAILPPLVINYDILYVQAKGSKVRDLSYNFFVNIYTGTDMTVLSSHLFDNHQLREWDWAEEPNKIIWCVRDDGVLLSFTYLKEQDVYAWARHDTG